MAKKISMELTEGDPGYKEFLVLKEKIGVKSNASVLRYLISREPESVRIPKRMADWIINSEWFPLYGSVEEFVVESVRRNMEHLMGAR